MEKLVELPSTALIALGVTLAIIIAVRYLGITAGANASPANSQGAAQVAAVIVDPTALNNATKALEAHTDALLEFIDVAKDVNRSLTHVGIELDRIREELRIQREVSRRPVN